MASVQEQDDGDKPRITSKEGLLHQQRSSSIYRNFVLGGLSLAQNPLSRSQGWGDGEEWQTGSKGSSSQNSQTKEDSPAAISDVDEEDDDEEIAFDFGADPEAETQAETQAESQALHEHLQEATAKGYRYFQGTDGTEGSVYSEADHPEEADRPSSPQKTPAQSAVLPTTPHTAPPSFSSSSSSVCSSNSNWSQDDPRHHPLGEDARTLSAASLPDVPEWDQTRPEGASRPESPVVLDEFLDDGGSHAEEHDHHLGPLEPKTALEGQAPAEGCPGGQPVSRTASSSSSGSSTAHHGPQAPMTTEIPATPGPTNHNNHEASESPESPESPPSVSAEEERLVSRLCRSMVSLTESYRRLHKDADEVSSIVELDGSLASLSEDYASLGQAASTAVRPRCSSSAGLSSGAGSSLDGSGFYSYLDDDTTTTEGLGDSGSAGRILHFVGHLLDNNEVEEKTPTATPPAAADKAAAHASQRPTLLPRWNSQGGESSVATTSNCSSSGIGDSETNSTNLHACVGRLLDNHEIALTTAEASAASSSAPSSSGQKTRAVPGGGLLGDDDDDDASSAYTTELAREMVELEAAARAVEQHAAAWKPRASAAADHHTAASASKKSRASGHGAVVHDGDDDSQNSVPSVGDFLRAQLHPARANGGDGAMEVPETIAMEFMEYVLEMDQQQDQEDPEQDLPEDPPRTPRNPLFLARAAPAPDYPRDIETGPIPPPEPAPTPTSRAPFLDRVLSPPKQEAAVLPLYDSRAPAKRSPAGQRLVSLLVVLVLLVAVGSWSLLLEGFRGRAPAAAVPAAVPEVQHVALPPEPKAPLLRYRAGAAAGEKASQNGRDKVAQALAEVVGSWGIVAPEPPAEPAPPALPEMPRNDMAAPSKDAIGADRVAPNEPTEASSSDAAESAPREGAPRRHYLRLRKIGRVALSGVQDSFATTAHIVEHELHRVQRSSHALGTNAVGAFVGATHKVQRAGQQLDEVVTHIASTSARIQSASTNLAPARTPKDRTGRRSPHHRAEPREGFAGAAGIRGGVRHRLGDAASHINGLANDLSSTHARIHGEARNLGGHESIHLVRTRVGSFFLRRRRER